MSNAVATVPNGHPPAPAGLSIDKVALIKRTVAKGCSDDELELFMHVATRTGLDPFARQIYAIRRREYDPETRNYVDKMVIQTGIDGYRVVADRTGRYAPGRPPEYAYTRDGKLASATAFVRKRTADGTWHEVGATAHWAEYVQVRKDGSANRMWSEKPHVMLGKVAEALALRRAFPMDLSGMYVHEEISERQEPEDPEPAPRKPARVTAAVATAGSTPERPPAKPPLPIGTDKANELRSLLDYHNRMSSKKKSVENLLDWVHVRTANPRRACLEDLIEMEYQLCKLMFQKHAASAPPAAPAAPPAEAPPAEREAGEGDEEAEFDGGPEPEIEELL